jgi:hypothetical protein
VGVMLRISFWTVEVVGRGWGRGFSPGSVCFWWRLGGRGEWYSQGTSAAAASGDSCGKWERRKAERTGSEGREDVAFVGCTGMFGEM